jgi:hypothetical protein
MMRRCLPFVALLLAACSSGGLVISPTQQLNHAQTQAYLTVDKYLWERWDEVRSIKVGTTYRELRRFFREDGGITFREHRFVNTLCPFIKLNINFEGEDTAPSPFWPIPDEARISSVSEPYFQPAYAD